MIQNYYNSQESIRIIGKERSAFYRLLILITF